MTTITIADSKNSQVANLESQKDLIKRMFCKGCSDDEMQIFLHACNRTGLDPFMKQIYAIKRKDQMTIQTGIDGLRLIAERTGNYSPGKESTFVHDEKGNIISATSYIKKRTQDGTWHEISAVAYMEEYNAKVNLWLKMPRAMLSKCAEALALRKGFPSEMSGLYTREEMEQAGHPKEERTEITEQEWAMIDSHILEINDTEYFNKLAAFVDAPTIYDIKPKDFDRIMKSIQKKIKQKGDVNGSEIVA